MKLDPGIPFDLRKYLMTRMDRQIVCHPDGDWLKIRVLSLVTGLAGSTLSSVQFGYGSFKFTGQIVNPDAKAEIFLFLLEKTHGTPDDIIYLKNVGANYYFGVSNGGTGTENTMTGQDWTAEKEFEIVWALNSAKCYVAGSLEETIVTNVPTPSMALGHEILTDPTIAPGGLSETWLKDLVVPGFTPTTF